MSTLSCESVSTLPLQSSSRGDAIQAKCHDCSSANGWRKVCRGGNGRGNSKYDSYSTEAVRERPSDYARLSCRVRRGSVEYLEVWLRPPTLRLERHLRAQVMIDQLPRRRVLTRVGWTRRRRDLELVRPAFERVPDLADEEVGLTFE